MRHSPLMLLPLLAACYTYAPIDPGEVNTGSGVRIRVSPAAAGRIAPLLGGADSRVIAGTMVENAPAGMIVEVPTLGPDGIGTAFQTLNQRVSIARSEVIEFEMRTLDRFRTGALVGIGAIVVGSAVFKVTMRDPGQEKLPGGTSSDIRVPLLRVFP